MARHVRIRYLRYQPSGGVYMLIHVASLAGCRDDGNFLPSFLCQSIASRLQMCLVMRNRKHMVQIDKAMVSTLVQALYGISTRRV